MRTTSIVGITALATAAVAVPSAIAARDNLGSLLPATHIAGSASGSNSLAAPNGGSGSSSSQTPHSPQTGTDGEATQSISGTSTTATAAQQKGVVLVDTVMPNGEGAGTGMVLRSDGTVLTNYHVVEGSTQIRVSVPGGQNYTASVVGHDASHDVAVLKLNGASGLATVDLDTDGVKLSEQVLAVGQGNGQGVLYAAKGIVTATDQSITANDSTALDPSEELTGLIQTNAPIVGGYSGGPLFDANGKVVGIDTAAAANNSLAAYAAGAHGTQAEGYAIPITQAKSIADTILAGKKNATNHIGGKAALGIAVTPTSSSSRGDGFDGAQSTSSGVVVQQVTAGSAAANAGLSAGDTVTSVAGTTLSDTSDLSNAMDRQYPGNSVKVTWTDSTGANHTATVTLQKATTN